MIRTVPPFRADQVGSLLRPPELKEARAKHARGEISEDELRAVEDSAIVAAIRMQESIGLKGVTDGEFRRAFWHFDFLEALEGVESYEAGQGIQFKGGQTKPKGLRVVGKISAPERHPMVEHFRFLRDQTRATAKMTIPSPSVLHYRGGRQAVDKSVYPDMEEFYGDLGLAYREVVRQFADAGCRYLQLDEVNFTYLCDPEQRQMLTDRGDDPEKMPGIYAAMINSAIAERPADMRITMHSCRGNFRSMWIAQGGYDPVAEVLFRQINVDGYFLEYDSDRAGGFEPLRLLPQEKVAVLGLVTSKTGALESKEFLKGRLDEVLKFIDLERVCLSPQCGFASTEEGNVLTADQQWAKLARIVEVAGELWGS